MRPRILTALCVASTLLGILFFALQFEYLIVRLPQRIPSGTSTISYRKKITFYYWQTDRWHHETNELVWSERREETMRHVINAWLHLIEDLDLCAKHITVQTVVASPNDQMVYCSFDRSPFSKEWTIYQKLMLIEGLLKTVRELFPSVHALTFLIRHQPLIDAHLDFSHAWPITGFLSALQ